MKRMKTHLMPLGARDKGVVLVVGLMFIMVLAAVGSVAYLTTSGDLLVSRNYRQHVEAGFVAEAALQEAKARLALDSANAFSISTAVAVGDDPRDWSVYIISGPFSMSDDSGFNALYTNDVITSSQSEMEYMVRIRYKRERDAELLGHTVINPHYDDNDGTASTAPGSMKPVNAPGNVLHLNSSGPFTTGPAVNPRTAIYLITAFARSGANGPIVSREMEVARLPGGDVPILGTVYSRDDVEVRGAPFVDGHDQCGGPGGPAIYALTPSTITERGAGRVHFAAPPPYDAAPTVTGPEDIDILALIMSLQGSADVVIGPGNYNTSWGAPNDYKVVFATGDIKFAGNGTSYGLLLVLGEVTVTGTYAWHGLIISTGGVDARGNFDLYGAIITDGDWSRGNPAFYYDSCKVQAALDALGSDTYAMLAWRDLSMMED
ncbi:MAG: pilus assembly PilX N-terminal domain-containing protein [Desulfatibacillaceae bacterium]|nr:pilus assembly PilX N-terminal domain-containing protein [Desulfatibacillaceae bacterium]